MSGPIDALEPDTLARILRAIGVVDPDDGTMPVYFRSDEPGYRVGAVKYYTPHHGVAERLIREIGTELARIEETPCEEEFWCKPCQDFFREGDHHHCPRCQGRASMMGHAVCLPREELA